MGFGTGFGKVILFGEHFVVYGIPSIVSAIDKTTTAIVESFEGKGWILEDKRGYGGGILEQQKDSMERMLKAAGIDTMKSPIKITLGGNLIAASGIGASAASCVAIARALSDEFGLGFSDERINEIAYGGEKAYHGIPSGVDNATATYGGLIWFVKGEPNVIQRMAIAKPVEVVIGNTGLVSQTSAAVAKVRRQREADPEKYSKIFKNAGDVVHLARKALESYDLETVGKLADENHRLLRAIGVSCGELDFLVELAREHGALGAKMTGGGLGGCMIALTPGIDSQEGVSRAIEREGFETLKTKIG